MQGFEAKRKALFACLDTVGKDLKGTTLDQSGSSSLTISMLRQPISLDEYSPTDGTLSKLRGKESIFKKPELPIFKCLKPRVVPDYQVNPHKWKRYSLADVDISDRTNTAAALSFLKEIESLKKCDEETEDTDQKVVFKKSAGLKRSLKSSSEVADKEVDGPKLKGSKLMMPEYVVGQKLEKEKIQKSSSSQAPVKSEAKAIMLSHLAEYDDGDDGE